MSKPIEKDHVAALGTRWAPVLAATSFSVRQNSKLIGLDKIRQPLAWLAALKATGFPVLAFTVPKAAGAHVPEIQTVVDGAFFAAVEAGKDVFVSVPA